MKALISPNETFDITWVSSWNWIEPENNSTPRCAQTYSTITNCIRVAEEKPDNEVFELALPLYWANCSDECNPDSYYFKDGQFYSKPQDEPVPSTPVQELP